MVLRGSHISVHHHVMAEASAHDEEMEDLVGAEIFMLRVEDRQFQRVDHTADGIDDAAGKEPSEAAGVRAATIWRIAMMHTQPIAM